MKFLCNKFYSVVTYLVDLGYDNELSPGSETSSICSQTSLPFSFGTKNTACLFIFVGDVKDKVSKLQGAVRGKGCKCITFQLVAHVKTGRAKFSNSAVWHFFFKLILDLFLKISYGIQKNLDIVLFYWYSLKNK